MLVRDQKLSRIRPGVGIDRDCFTPQQLRSTSTESRPAAERQLVRSAVDCSVAPFHRVNGEPIPNGPVCDRQRFECGLDVIFEPDMHAERSNFLFERPAIGKESVAGHYFEGHPVAPDKPSAHAIAFSSSCSWFGSEYVSAECPIAE